MRTYIAELTDHGALGSPIVWRTTSIAEARELLVNVGAWQSSPDTGDAILLGSSAFVALYIDSPPFREDDDLPSRLENKTAYAVFDRGPRGGVRRLA